MWNDRVFLTTATDNGADCHVLALDRKTGNVVWDKEVFREVPGHKQQRNGYATPTPCTDGEHRLGTSPLLWKNLLIMTRRSNGDYLVFMEEDWKGKSMIYGLVDPLRKQVATK